MNWDGMASNWDLVLPPNRPPAWWLGVVADTLAHRDRLTPVAVLGSTPEYLDILARLGFRTVAVLDGSPEFHEAVRSQRLYLGHESLIEGDWLETLADLDGQLGIVLSDLTLGNIPYDAQGVFCGLIEDALMPGGIVIDRVLRNESGMQPLDQLHDRYQARPFNLATLNDFNADYLFSSALVEDAGMVDSTRLIERLSRPEVPEYVRRLATHVHLITPEGRVWWYGRRWSSVAAGYFPRLHVVRTVPSPAGPFFGFVDGVILERAVGRREG